MRCVIVSDEKILRDDLGLGNELMNYAQLVLQSGTVVSLRIHGLDIDLVPLETIAGKLVLGVTKGEPLTETVRCYVNQLLLNEKRWPETVERLSAQIEPWRGRRLVGLLFAEDFAHRCAYREKLSSLAITVINIGERDLYVFSTDLLPTVSRAKLSVSSPCEDPREAVRQALVVQRYVVGVGTHFYERLFEYNLSVEIDERDAEIVRQRLLSSNLQDFANRLNTSLSDAFLIQKRLEEKYLLRFDVGLECHVLASALAQKGKGGKP